jgi:hypothetical protein
MQGRCLCGAVTWSMTQALLCQPTLCHCESCRRASGAHALPWITVADDALTLMGETLTWFASSPPVQRGFCRACGTPLAYRHRDRPGETDLTLGSADNPSAWPPVDHIWMSDALPWDRPVDGLPQYAGRRPGP